MTKKTEDGFKPAHIKCDLDELGPEVTVWCL